MFAVYIIKRNVDTSTNEATEMQSVTQFEATGYGNGSGNEGGQCNYEAATPSSESAQGSVIVYDETS